MHSKFSFFTIPRFMAVEFSNIFSKRKKCFLLSVDCECMYIFICFPTDIFFFVRNGLFIFLYSPCVCLGAHVCGVCRLHALNQWFLSSTGKKRPLIHPREPQA